MRYDACNPVDHAASLIQTCEGNAEEALALARLNVDFAHGEARDYWDRVAIAIQQIISRLSPGVGAGIQRGQQELVVQEVPQPRLLQPAAARSGRVVHQVDHAAGQGNEIDERFQPGGQGSCAQRGHAQKSKLSHLTPDVQNCSLSKNSVPVAFLGPYGEVLRLAMADPEEIEFANQLLRALGCDRRWAQLSEN
jgi:hypothetical protein